MSPRIWKVIATNLVLVVSAVAWSCAMAAPAGAAAQSTPKAFATPQEAAEALLKAADPFDAAALLEIFGPVGKDFVSSADPVRDKNNAQAFAAKARVKHGVTLDPKNPARAILTVGNDDWPLPVPIVKKKGTWQFNAKEGHDEILFRRIGANELDAIEICRGFVDAQIEYASMAREITGVAQYAQRIISSPGKRDGLFWQNPDGSPGGPVSEPVARAIEEGYKPGAGTGYHGYHFKVLKGQGPAARLGQLDYVINGVMIGGFALLAAPAEYRVTGVKTFMVSYDGVVYEKDLGPDSLKIAQGIERYNPDKSWRRTDDGWSTPTTTATE